MNLDLGDDQKSNDSEVEREEEIIEPSNRVPAPVSAERSEERGVVNVHLTKERLERLYVLVYSWDVPSSYQLSQISESCVSTSSAVSSVMPTTLAAVVADDRLFVMFLPFLKYQYKVHRNLGFWLACEHYRHLPIDNREHLLTVAMTIYTKFIKNSAYKKVDIHAVTKKSIKKMLHDYKSEPLTVQLFDTAQQEIWEVMKRNEFLKFAVYRSHAIYSQFEGLSLPSTSYMANLLRGASSLQHLGLEDSTSLSSFSTE